MKKKKMGEVFTPTYIVDNILDLIGYKGEEILNKHIIDNSCGEGVFLVEIVKRILFEYYSLIDRNNIDLKEILETYVHGIEISEVSHKVAIQNLNTVLIDNYLDFKVDWDVTVANTLKVDLFDDKMDFVVGNPPYVRVHNLSSEENNYKLIKNNKFAQKGMTDLYLVFFELSIRMLNNSGKLGFITPSSYFSSNAGLDFREYIVKNNLLKSVVDLKHFQPFKATTYTCITILDKQHLQTKLNYYEYDGIKLCPSFIEILDYSNVFVNDKLFFARTNELDKLKKVIEYRGEDYFKVKNGLATLADKIFISDKFDFESDYIIPCIKSSTGVMKEVIFPYENAKPVSINIIMKEEKVYNYLLNSKEDLLDRSISNEDEWYLFGRTQALIDVYKEKVTIGNLISAKKNLRVNQIGENVACYSGLYIIPNSYLPLSRVIKILKNHKDLLNYVKILSKYKSGGYYTFSSKDMQKYINYNLQEEKNG